MLEEAAFKMGTCWAVYVKPSHRRRGIGEALMQRCVAHWRSTSCLRGVLLHATASGRALYEKIGFAPHNGMVIELPPEPPMREPLAAAAATHVHEQVTALSVDCPKARTVIPEQFRLSVVLEREVKRERWHRAECDKLPPLQSNVRFQPCPSWIVHQT